MIFIIDRFDPSLFEDKFLKEYQYLTMWETYEEQVRSWLRNERCRSIFGKKEVMNLFQTGKIQMVQVKKMHPTPFDKVILWTNEKRFYVLEFLPDLSDFVNHIIIPKGKYAG